MKDGVVNGFKLVDISAELTAVDMSNYKSTTDPSTTAKVEQVIGEKIILLLLLGLQLLVP